MLPVCLGFLTPSRVASEKLESKKKVPMEKSGYELFELRKNHKRKKPSTFLKNSKTAAQIN
jgi:hypothetical protein